MERGNRFFILIFYFLFLTLSYNLSAAEFYPTLSPEQRQQIPINDSLRSVEGINSHFPFRSCSVIPSGYGFAQCNDFVADFCIENQFSTYSSIQSLTSEEQNTFNSSLSKLQSAEQSVISMKEKLTRLLLSKNCTVNNLTISVPVPFINIRSLAVLFNYEAFKSSKTKIDFPFSQQSFTVSADCDGVVIPIISNIIDFLVDVIISFDHYIELQTSIYENSASAMNDLFDRVTQQADSLYFEGAGYSNYTTSAYTFYNSKIKSFIYKSKTNQIKPTEFDITSNDFSSYFIYVREVSKKVANERTNRLSNCEMSVMASPSYVIAFNYLIDLHREILEQRAALRSNYEELKKEAEDKFKDAGTKYRLLIDNEYSKITPEIYMYALNISQTTTLPINISAPSDEILKMSEDLYGSGSVTSVENLINSAKSDEKAQVIFYYAKGIEKFSTAIRLADSAINKSSQIEEVAGSVLISLNEKVKSKLDAAYSNLSKYPVYDTASESMYNLLNSKYSNASSIYNNYNPSNTTKGERITQLYNAAIMLDDVIRISNTKISDAIEMKKKSMKDAIDELNSTIKKADIDLVDTIAEKELLKSKSQLLGMKIDNASFIEDSTSTLIQAKEGLYKKAQLMYSDLPSLRSRVISILSSVSNYIDTSQYSTKMSEYEKTLCIQSNFDPLRCLGSYNSLASNYTSLLNELNKNSASILSKYLSNRYSAKTLFDSTPTVDSFVNMTTYIDLENDLSLSSDSQTEIKIKGIPFSFSSIVESDIQGIYAMQNGDYVSIYFPSIKSNTHYSIKIKSYMKPATTVKRETKRLSLTNDKLTEQITYTIDSVYDLDSLILNDIYTADSCSVFLNDRMQKIRSLLNLSIQLSNVKSGKQTIIATCSKNKPITYMASDFITSDNKITYSLQLRATYEDLSNVEYIIEIMGSADQIQSDSIRVYDSSGKVPDKFEFYKSNNKYYAKWFIPLLSSEYQNYTVSYITTDIVSYYTKLKSEIENLSSSESIDVSNYLRDAAYRASRGNYDQAVDSLEKARREISNVQVKREENLSLTQKLNDISSRISDLKNKSSQIYQIATNLSLSDVSVEIAKQISEFEKNEQVARQYLIKGDTDNAKKVISNLEKVVYSTKVDDAIRSKEKKLYDFISDAEKTVVNLGKFTNISSMVSKLNAIKSKVALIDPSFATQDYYNALTNLNDAFQIKEELNSEITNSSIQIGSTFDLKLKSTKETLDLWKKNRQYILAAFSIDKNSPIQELPESIKQILMKINETDSLSAQLNQMYSQLKDYKLEEKIMNIDQFQELESKTNQITKDTEYYNQLLNQYKSNANELIKDVGLLFEEKLSKGSDSEKKKVIELQPILASAKDQFTSGKYLNAVILSKYARDQLSSVPAGNEVLDLTLVIYVALVLIISFVIFRIFSKREPPRPERKLEKVKLD